MTVEARRVVAAPTHPKAWNPYWWVYPTWVVIALTAFGIYAIYAMVQKAGFYSPYLSPFYSPEIKIGALPFSPALYVLWVPLGFRATCYYYRKAYFRSFFRQPPACAVPDRPGKYNGESRFPFILNNAHRYFLYLSIIVVGFLWWDAITAFDFHGRFGIGLGSVILLVNVIFLSGYTFGCHALRNIVGGGVNCYSCMRSGKPRKRAWSFVSMLNGRHPTWAWISMGSVALADIYIRLLLHGVIVDPRWVS